MVTKMTKNCLLIYILLQAVCCISTTSSEVLRCNDSTVQLVARHSPTELIAMILLKLLLTTSLTAVVTPRLTPITTVLSLEMPEGSI